MKKILTAKLKSNSGASLMAALLFFVMAATVGSIVLAAATASSGRLAGLKRDEQAHYAVNSAADMFSKLLEDKEVILKLTLTEEDGTRSTTLSYVDPSDTAEVLNNPDALILPSLVNSLYSSLTYNAKFPDYELADLDDFTGKKEVTIVVNNDNDNHNGLNVKATVSMNKALDLLVVFEPAAAGATGTVKVRYTAVIETKETIDDHDMENTVDVSGDKRNTVRNRTYTVRWTNPVME